MVQDDGLFVCLVPDGCVKMHMLESGQVLESLLEANRTQQAIIRWKGIFWDDDWPR